MKLTEPMRRMLVRTAETPDGRIAIRPGNRTAQALARRDLARIGDGGWSATITDAGLRAINHPLTVAERAARAVVEDAAARAVALRRHLSELARRYGWDPEAYGPHQQSAELADGTPVAIRRVSGQIYDCDTCGGRHRSLDVVRSDAGPALTLLGIASCSVAPTLLFVRGLLTGRAELRETWCRQYPHHPHAARWLAEADQIRAAGRDLEGATCET